MHKYLKSNYIRQNQENNTALPLVSMLPLVIKSTTSIKALGFGYAFKVWNYVMATVCFMLGEILLYTNVTSLCCLDIGCNVIPVNRAWLLEKARTEKILKIGTLLKVRDIGSSWYESDEFVFMSFYFPGIDSTNRPAYAHIHRKLHIVKGLKTKLLVGNNILAMEKMIINFANKFAKISIY